MKIARRGTPPRPQGTKEENGGCSAAGRATDAEVIMTDNSRRSTIGYPLHGFKQWRQIHVAVSICLLMLGFMSGCSRKEPDRLTIIFSNDTMGKIRSCGCPKNDLGGLGRRTTFIHAVRDTARALLVVDGGDFFGMQINYGKEKADLTMKSMVLMGYDAAVPGEAEFSLGADYLHTRAGEIGLPLLACNIMDAGSGKPLFPSYKVVTYPDGLRIGLIGVFGEKMQMPPQVEPGTLRIASPLQRVRAIMEKLQPETDLIVVIAHMEFHGARELAQKQDGIDLIVYGHHGRPMRTTRQINGAYLLQVPREGKYVGIATAILGPDRRIESLAVKQQPMSKEFSDDEAVVKLFDAYDINIALKEKSVMPTGVTDPSRTVRKPFVTAGRCKECHEAIFESWRTTRHAAAFDTLIALSRNYDRDCTPCHTTGFYNIGGFVNAATTPDLVNVQCEACHGNGFDHSAHPGTKTAGLAHDSCMPCHTEEWSPAFDATAEWRKIAH